MARQHYQRLSPADIDEIWTRLRAGHSVKPTARALGLPTSTVRTYLIRCGGIRPDPRHRGAGRLSLEEREEISRGLAAGLSLRAIAAGLGRSPSTISREVAGNGGRRRYRATVADQAAWARATRPKACKLATNPVLAGIVTEKLQRRWSPQQIAGWLKLTYPDDPGMHVSHESIYRTLFVQSRGALRKELTAYLRTGRVIRRSHGMRLPDGRGARPGIVNISERPAEAEDRAVPGHWEGDLVFGQRHEPGRHPGRAIHPLPDARRPAGRQPQGRRRRRRPGRRSRAPARAPGEVADLGPGPRDGRAQRFTDETGIQVYFCDPKSPWQRGSNENTNGLLRQYLPRRLDFRTLTQDDLDAIALELNDRPRQTLGFKTPSQALAEVLR